MYLKARDIFFPVISDSFYFAHNDRLDKEEAYMKSIVFDVCLVYHKINCTRVSLHLFVILHAS